MEITFGKVDYIKQTSEFSNTNIEHQFFVCKLSYLLISFSNFSTARSVAVDKGHGAICGYRESVSFSRFTDNLCVTNASPYTGALDELASGVFWAPHLACWWEWDLAECTSSR